MPYRVWVAIEHEKSDGTYEEMDCPGSSLSDFTRYNQAFDFAAELYTWLEGKTAAEVRKTCSTNHDFDKTITLLQVIALGNTEADTMADRAAELLTHLGYTVRKIAEHQYATRPRRNRPTTEEKTA